MRNLTPATLALANLKRKPFRTAGLIIISVFLSFILFGGSILSSCLKNGLNSVSDRFGADIMVVPLGYDEDMEGILLKGEPSYFYLDKAVLDSLKDIEGIKDLSPQFFLTSTNQDCCDIPVQFIGFDPDTDFSVTPWISESYADSGLIVGSDIEIKNGKSLKFFDKEYTVAAKLEETGTGLDQAVYADMELLKDLFAAAKSKGLSFTADIDPDNTISTVLIKLDDGYTAEEVRHNIRSRIDGLQVIITKSMITKLSDSLVGLSAVIYIIFAIILISSIITLTVIFSVIAHERCREFAVIRMLGSKTNFPAKIIMAEAVIITSAGALSGTALAAAVVFPFSTLISDTLKLPYMLPDALHILIYILISILVTIAAGPVSTAATAIKISKAEPYELIKEGN